MTDQPASPQWCLDATLAALKVFWHRTYSPADIADVAAIIATHAAVLVDALEAHAAWSWAEEQHELATFHERMELCKYAEWLTAKALHLAKPDMYQGVPRLIVWPAVIIDQAGEGRVQAIVDRLLTAYRAACAKEQES